MVRKAVQGTRSHPYESAERLTKAMTIAGIQVDNAIPSGRASSFRNLNDLCGKQVHIYNLDEERVEGKQMHMRLYLLKERAIKKRDIHHRGGNNDKLTLRHGGLQGVAAAITLLVDNNRKPFNSYGFGQERAELAGYMLSEFGPEHPALTTYAMCGMAFVVSLPRVGLKGN